MCKSSNLTTRKQTRQDNRHYGPMQATLWVSVACACMLYAQHARAAGGCGSVCIPLESLDLDKAQIPINQYRLSLISEYAKFDNFREGSKSLNNPGGNKATIIQNTLAIDYGLSKKWTVTALVPYINKKQDTNRFGTRSAKGIGDISLFGRYEVLPDHQRLQLKSLSLGLGIKLPTGSIDEPGNGPLLPPAFQAGSGAYDLIPTMSFFRPISKGALFGGLIWRIPLEDNKRGYKFGQEIEINLGVDYPAKFINKNLSFQMSSSYLYADNDKDSNGILPARLRNGTKVLNTGGKFFYLTPGARLKLSRNLTMQARISIPVYENWNGNRATSVGQVAPDIISQLTLIYTGK
ncbi:MAG: transporter [Gammaproteobacteria bacterium]|nr:transporter [Gammaproteobacteria bacterium]